MFGEGGGRTVKGGWRRVGRLEKRDLTNTGSQWAWRAENEGGKVDEVDEGEKEGHRKVRAR